MPLDTTTQFDDFKVSGAIAYSEPSVDQQLFDGSISILHDPSGISLTVAAAYSDEAIDDGRYGYVKLGYQTDFFEVGKTAMSVDAYYGEDIAANGSDSTSFGAQLVQNLDYLADRTLPGRPLLSIRRKQPKTSRTA